MSDYEELLDAIISAHRRAGAALWDVSRDVHALFEEHGRMEAEFMGILTNQCHCGKDSIYHYRKAWSLRVSISAEYPVFEWDGLLVSHAYTAADFIMRLGVEAVKDWLDLCREESWSSRKLGAELSTAANDSGTRPWLLARLRLESSKLAKLYTMSEQAGFSDRERRRLKRVISIIDNMAQAKTPLI